MPSQQTVHRLGNVFLSQLFSFLGFLCDLCVSVVNNLGECDRERTDVRGSPSLALQASMACEKCWPTYTVHPLRYPRWMTLDAPGQFVAARSPASRSAGAGGRSATRWFSTRTRAAPE